jgi:hypothetical protein
MGHDWIPKPTCGGETLDFRILTAMEDALRKK